MSIAGSSDIDSDSAVGSPELVAHAVESELSQIGLRYESVTSHSSDSALSGGGSAVLTQLSLLATIAPSSESQDAERDPVSAARLAVAPRSVIDAYAAGPCESERCGGMLESLLSLITETEDILERRKADKPRRRGPIRRGPKVGGEAVRTRFVCMSGSSKSMTGGARKELADAKLINVTGEASAAPPVYVRPAIKPLASTTVTLSLGSNEIEQASFVAFDL